MLLNISIHRNGFYVVAKLAFPNRETVRFMTPYGTFRTAIKPVPHRNKSRFPH